MIRYSLCLALALAFSTPSFSQQASLSIKNKSDRQLTVKVMQGPEKKAVVVETVKVAPKGTQTVYFSTTGTYFTKSQGIFINKKDSTMNDTIYSKERPFQVISDKRRGFSNITMEYKVKETKKPEPGGPIPISRKEYDN